MKSQIFGGIHIFFIFFFRSIEQFIRTVKIQNNFWWQNVFLTCSWRFPKSNESEQLEFKPEKLLGFRNMQEKLEKAVNLPYLQKTDLASFYINELTLTNVKRMLDIRFILWMVSNAKIFPLKNSLVNKKLKLTICILNICLCLTANLSAMF